MRRSTALLSALVLWGLGFAAAAAPAKATVLIRSEAGDLADGSALVFVGTVVDQQVKVTGDGRYPYTFVTFQVEKVLKGEADVQLTLRFDGGPVGQESVKVFGVPEFKVGKRHLLFVAGADKPFCPLAGWEQGKLDFVPHPVTGEEVLADSQGRLVTGVERNQFRRIANPRAGKVKVLQENGVKVTLPDQQAAAPGEDLRAEKTVDQLESWLHARKAGAKAVPAGRVRSARPEEVPQTAPVLGGVR